MCFYDLEQVDMIKLIKSCMVIINKLKFVKNATQKYNSICVEFCTH